MMADNINIVPYDILHQPQIDMLMMHISKEFSEPIFILKPNSTAIPVVMPDLYLLAIINDNVAGTISLTKLNGGNSVLKKMFLHKDFRKKGIAKKLLMEVMDWAFENKIKAIYLGTMLQFIEAQKFYKSNGFEKISIGMLPEDFPINPLDTIFYQLKLV